MTKRAITVEELFAFALRNGGADLKTKARSRRFTLQATSEFIRFLLPSQTYFSVNREFAKLYVKYYNKVSVENADRTTPYPKKWRERSYMVSLLQDAREELESRETSLARHPAATTTRNSLNEAKIGSGIVKTSRKWTKDELLIALNLYHKMTFGKMDARNPTIIAVAEKMDRGPSSLAMKLCNLASLDPALRMRGIKGLSGASALDRSVWAEFHENLSEAAPASEQAFQNLFGGANGDEVEVRPTKGIQRRAMPSGPTEGTAAVKVRRGQAYFRDAVLNNFGGHCGITGLAVRELLIASHILPWGKYESERLNIQNGIALSRLHDAAFDIGLIAFDTGLRLRLSKALKSHLPQRTVTESFAVYEGEALHLEKDAILPDERFLAIHRAASLQRWS